jgi:hypothetical protein
MVLFSGDGGDDEKSANRAELISRRPGELVEPQVSEELHNYIKKFVLHCINWRTSS